MVRKYQKTECKQWSGDDIATLIEFYPNTPKWRNDCDS